MENQIDLPSRLDIIDSKRHCFCLFKCNEAVLSVKSLKKMISTKGIFIRTKMKEVIEL